MITERIKKIQNKLDCHEAMLITSDCNRFYFTGMKSSAGTVVITKENSYLLIDFRYIEKAKSVVKSCKVLLSQRTDSEIKEILESENVKKIYVETFSLSISQFNEFKNAFEGIEVSSCNSMNKYIETIRSIKTKEEIEYIKKAQDFTDRTFTHILEKIEAGRTEREIMLEMNFYMQKLGSEGISFDTIVVSGKKSSMPHGVPSDKIIEKGDFITMDFGSVYNGYRSDMTRTVAVGFVTDEQKHIYDTVLKAQFAALDAVKAGVVCKDMDKIARDIIYNEGYEGCFGHGLGHSVGIEIHETPNFNMRDETVLQEGTVMTVEPGIYVENFCGVRIEDMVVATNDGCINLTHSKKDLIIL